MYNTHKLRSNMAQRVVKIIGYIDKILIVVLLMMIVSCFVVLVIVHWRRHMRNSVVINWPVIGMLPGILKNAPRTLDYTTELVKSGGGTFEFKGPWFTNRDVVFTSDPMNVQHILCKNFSNYPKGPQFNMIFEPLGDGIFNSDSDLWKYQRKMFQLLIISQTKFQTYMEKTIQRKVVDGLIPLLDHVCNAKTQVDLQTVFQRLTFDSTFLLVFGFDPLSLSMDVQETNLCVKFTNVEFENAFNEVQEVFVYRHLLPQSWWKLQKWLQIGREKKMSKAFEIFEKIIYQLISSKREELSSRSKTQHGLKDDSADNFDMVTAYMQEEEDEEIDQGQVHDPETVGRRNSYKFLRDTAVNFIAAGRDTVSAGLTWFLWLVATHPVVETKILQEMRDQLGDDVGEGGLVFGAQQVTKLVYLQAALCETLRLYPPVPRNHKAPSQPDTLPSGHRLKRNQRIILHFYGMGRMEELWGEDCLEFKPERWINIDSDGVPSILSVAAYKFPAFNAGPRTCLGKHMSFIQMKIVAASFLWNYRVQLVENNPISPRVSIILHMEHGLKARISKRSDHVLES